MTKYSVHILVLFIEICIVFLHILYARWCLKRTVCSGCDVMCLLEAGDTPKIHFHDVDKTSASLAALNTSTDAGSDLSMEFVRLQKLLGRVAMELDEEDKMQTGGGGLVAEDRLSAGSDAVLMTMLRYVMRSGRQAAKLDLSTQMTTYSNDLRRVTDCIEVLDNFTLNGRLASILMSPWNEVEQVHVLLVGGSVPRQVIEAFRLCRQNFAGAANSKGDTGADQSSVVDDVLRQYMNKTLETVSQLSHTVQTTLNRVKTLPDEIFAENKTAKKIGRKLTEAVSKLNSKVQSGWKHIAGRFDDIRKKWFGYSESKKMCKQKKREDWKKQRAKKNGNDDKFPVKHFTESDEKVVDKERSYKQTKSAPTGKEGGEYGPQKHFEDFLHSSQLDDFFEDNHRAWRQHNNRRLRKIGGRIERLNEEMFLSMDDDDVEDTYEDLKDVGEDMEKRDMTDDLRTWMSCQLRWWKTRIHRKHRAEDLVKGCGRQLMHWQLRVLCKQQQQDKQPNALPYLHLCDAVMTPKPAYRRQNSPYDVPSASPDVGSSEKTGGWGELAMKNDSCLDGEWYFRRVQDREDRRQLSPQWYFDRVEDRRYSRVDANWYMRAMRHNSDVVRVADYGHQRPSDGDVKGHHTGQN